MKKIYLTFISIFLIYQGATAQIVTHANGEIEIPNVISSAGPLGIGSLLYFSSGSANTVIQENWGLNLIGETSRPVRVFNASLLVGFPLSGGTNYGVGNAYINGNVGIGTTTPNTSLDVRQGAVSIGNGNLDPAYTNLNFLAHSGRMLIGQNRTGGGNETDFISNGGGYTGGFAFYTHDESNNENLAVWILGTNGNVLIGKPSQYNPAYKLDVGGSVRANQMVVNTNGADFVYSII